MSLWGGGISHLNYDQRFPLKCCLSDLESGKSVLFSRIVLCLPPALSGLLNLLLMLSGLFQIDFSVIMALSPCPPRSNTDKPSLTAAGDIRPGSSGGLKAWTLCQASQIDSRDIDKSGEG